MTKFLQKKVLKNTPKPIAYDYSLAFSARPSLPLSPEQQIRIHTVATILVADTARFRLNTNNRGMKVAWKSVEPVVDCLTRRRRVDAQADARLQVEVSGHYSTSIPVGAFNLLQPTFWTQPTTKTYCVITHCISNQQPTCRGLYTLSDRLPGLNDARYAQLIIVHVSKVCVWLTVCRSISVTVAVTKFSHLSVTWRCGSNSCWWWWSSCRTDRQRCRQQSSTSWSGSRHNGANGCRRRRGSGSSAALNQLVAVGPWLSIDVVVHVVVPVEMRPARDRPRQVVDVDADTARHINALVLTLFCRLSPELVVSWSSDDRLVVTKHPQRIVAAWRNACQSNNRSLSYHSGLSMKTAATCKVH